MLTRWQSFSAAAQDMTPLFCCLRQTSCALLLPTFVAFEFVRCSASAERVIFYLRPHRWNQFLVLENCSSISGHLKNVLISIDNPIEMRYLIYMRDLTDFTNKGCPLDRTREASVKMWMWTRPKWLKIILWQIFPGLPVGAKLITHRLISSLLTMQLKNRKSPYRCCLIVLIDDVLMY